MAQGTSDAGSAFSAATSAAGSAISGAGSVFTSLTCECNTRDHCLDGPDGDLLAIGGSAVTVVTSAGGAAITLASSGAGKVTSFAGSQYTVATAAAASA